MEYYKAIKYYVVKGYFKPWGMFQIEMKRPYSASVYCVPMGISSDP